MVRTGSNWLRIGTSGGGGSCEHGDKPSGSLKLLGNFSEWLHN
jgi:hypothetical protein